MITLSELKAVIENGLNAMSSREFKLFADVGEYQKAYKPDDSNTVTRYINGILEALAPSRLPIKNLQVITQTFRISFVLDMALLEKDTDGEYLEVKQVRDLLEKYIIANNGKPYYLEDAEQVSFEVTPSFSGITVGTASLMSPIGNVLPVYLDFSCVFVEGGTNTNTVDFIVNGENMFYQDYSITRTRTAETNMIANEPSSKTLAQANGISLQLKMPLLNTEQSKAIESDVWSGTQNEAVCVERVRHAPNNTTIYNAYIMIYGNNAENGSIGQNIGQVVDFVEGKQNELIYGTKWSTFDFTATNEEMTFTGAISITGLKRVIVFWGDGKSETITPIRGNVNLLHTYTQVGAYKIRIFKVF